MHDWNLHSFVYKHDLNLLKIQFQCYVYAGMRTYKFEKNNNIHTLKTRELK